MDHLAAPLETLRARAMEWLLDEKARLLHVQVDPELFEGARAILSGLEWAPDNQCPLVELGQIGWAARAEELRELYEVHRETYERATFDLPELPPPPSDPDPLAAFAGYVAAASMAFDKSDVGTRGIIVLFAPSPAEAREATMDALPALLTARGLKRARWIWLDSHGDALAPADDAIWVVACRIDPAAQKQETDEMLAAMVTALGTAAQGSPTAARPNVAPPHHPGDPPAGSTPAPHLQPMLLGIQALRASAPEKAMQHFRQAREAALGAGLTAESVEMEILLGSAGAQHALAQRVSIQPVVSVFDSAATRAESLGLLPAAAKARFLLGMYATAAREVELAARSLVAAAEIAKKAGDPVLRFHALRAAGELAFQVGVRARGAELWGEAQQVVKEMDPLMARSTGLQKGAEDIGQALRERTAHPEKRTSPTGGTVEREGSPP